MTETPLRPETPATEDSHPRRIRSFAKRQGRITPGQQKALIDHWSDYGLDPGQLLHPESVFSNNQPLILEIGFGNGDSLFSMAQHRPDQNFIGIEVHRPGVGHLLLQVHEAGLSNLRIYDQDALEILEHCIPDQTLDRIQLFFPDPWHKTRHHKRRIVKPNFLELIACKLSPGGHFHAATDWEDYAMDMVQQLTSCELFESIQHPDPFSPRPDYRPQTKFESRGQRLGHGVWDLIWSKKDSGAFNPKLTEKPV